MVYPLLSFEKKTADQETNPTAAIKKGAKSLTIP